MYGAEMMLLNLAREQILQGLQPIICSIGENHCGMKAIEVEACKSQIPVESFRMRSGPNAAGALEILKYAKAKNCDLLHSHGYKGNILFGYIPKRIRILPLITTVHGWTSTGTAFSLMRLYEWLDSLTLFRMDAVVLVNKNMLSHPNLIGKKKVRLHIVDNGIVEKEPVAYPRENLQLKQDRGLNLVAVGRLSPEKGFDVLLKSLARVGERGVEVTLVLFGEGGGRRKLEDLISQLGLQKRVKMPGFFENAAATFSYFDALVMPSLTEGLPITLLEAMRAKLPVIASKVGGIPDVLRNGVSGLLVRKGDVEELATAIRKLASSQSTRRELSREAHLIFLKNYSAAQMAASYRKIYSEILS